MRKKTALRTPQQRETSVRKQGGLIVQGENAQESATAMPALAESGHRTCAPARPGPLQDFYHGVIARGTREELARLTLTRKLAALTLRLWKKGEQIGRASCRERV